MKITSTLPDMLFGVDQSREKGPDKMYIRRIADRAIYAIFCSQGGMLATSARIYEYTYINNYSTTEFPWFIDFNLAVVSHSNPFNNEDSW